jgi:uncharacterized protein (UPF0332 family)
MEKLSWCVKQAKGIKLIEPNMNLCQAYIKKAIDSLDVIQTSQSRDWKIIAAYYAIYDSLYALLMQIGIKCEIHSCTLTVVESFLRKHFTPEDILFVQSAFFARIDAQYYVDKSISNEKLSAILENTPKFCVKCQQILFPQNERDAIRFQIQHFCT